MNIEDFLYDNSNEDLKEFDNSENKKKSKNNYNEKSKVYYVMNKLKNDYKDNLFTIENMSMKELKEEKVKLERLLVAMRLERLKKVYANKDTTKMEDELFDKLGCKSDKDRILLEAKYIATKLVKNRDKYASSSNFDSNLSTILDIIRYIDKIRPDKYSEIKKCIIIIELELNLSVSFISEINNIDTKEITGLNKKYDDDDNGTNQMTRGL